MNMNLVKLVEDFRTEDACRDYLVDVRWPDGISCPRCAGTTISKIHKRGQFDCDSCRYQFSVLAGTIFHDTKLPLWKWFAAVYLMCESKKGMSANQMKRTLNVSYKTAWYLCHRIRAAMGAVVTEQLEGVVEADETFVGGKPRFQNLEPKKDWRGRRLEPRKVGASNKAVVLGAIERGGNVRLRLSPDRTRKSLHAFLTAEVGDGAEAIFTDDWRPYRGIADEDTRHEVVTHSEYEWVRGDVHTNGIESVWSLLKRAIIGSYHHTSVKHLQSYLDEMEWRYNNRDNEWLFKDTLKALVSAETLPYSELISSQPA